VNIQANKIGISSAATFGILWIICSTAVHFALQPMMIIAGYMMHSNLSTLSWTLTFTGFLTELVAWAAVAGISGWLLASIYNRLQSGLKSSYVQPKHNKQFNSFASLLGRTAVGDAPINRLLCVST